MKVLHIMKRKYNNKVDDNQPALVAFWREAGAVVTPVSGDPTVGFDVIVSFRGRSELVEIKDGDKPPSKRRLTQAELDKQAELEKVGCKLNVVETEKQALALLNSM